MISLIPVYFDSNLKKYKADFEFSQPWDIKLKVISLTDSSFLRIEKTKKGYSVVSDSLNFSLKPELFSKSMPVAFIVCEIWKYAYKLYVPDFNDYKKVYLSRIPDFHGEFVYYTDIMKFEDVGLDFNKDNEISKYKIANKKRYEFLKKCFHNTPEISRKNFIQLCTDLDNETNEINKVNKIYKYVQKNIRYVAKEDSAHSFVPHHPAEVLSNGYGDCKDMSFLIKALAALYQINIETALINSLWDHPDSIAGDILFNHVIALYNKNQETFFLDATDEYASLYDIPDYLVNHKYMVLKNDTENFLTVPANNSNHNIKINVNADTDSLSIANAEIILKGSVRSSTLSSLDNTKFADKNNYLSRLLSGNFVNILFKDLYIKEKTDSLLVIHATADMSKFIIKSNAKIYFRKTPFNFVSAGIIEREKDPYHINITSPKSLNLVINLIDIKEKPEGQNLNFTSGSNMFQSMCYLSDQHLVLDYDLQVARKTYFGQEKSEFLNFVKEYNKKRNEMFIHKKEIK